jgi:hypothetical protein
MLTKQEHDFVKWGVKYIIDDLARDLEKIKAKNNE